MLLPASALTLLQGPSCLLHHVAVPPNLHSAIGPRSAPFRRQLLCGTPLRQRSLQLTARNRRSADDGNRGGPSWTERIAEAIARAMLVFRAMLATVAARFGLSVFLEGRRRRAEKDAAAARLYRTRGSPTRAQKLRKVLTSPQTLVTLAAVLACARLALPLIAPRSVAVTAKPLDVPMSQFLDMVRQAGASGLSDLQVRASGTLEYLMADGRKALTYQVELPWEMVQYLRDHHVPFRSSARSSVGGIIRLFPLFWLAFLYTMLRRSIGDGGVGTAGTKAGTSSASALDRSITFDDVAGIDPAKAEVKELVDMLKDPTPYVKAGARLPSGVIMVGPPGTGKTLLARAMAAEAGVPFFYSSGSDFVEMYVGRGAARVRKLFARAVKAAPCIVFLDELDAMGKRRSGGGLRASNDEAEQTLNQLLACMDGVDTNDNGVVVVAATNRFDALDEALTRPGRFDRVVKVPVPDETGRRAILRVHAKGLRLAGGAAQFEKIVAEAAEATPGMTGAELATLVNEAAIRAVRRGATTTSSADFRDAIASFYASRARLPTNPLDIMKGLLS